VGGGFETLAGASSSTTVPIVADPPESFGRVSGI
jgi:hypothetical protein